MPPVCHLVLLTLREDEIDHDKVITLIDRCLKFVPGLIELHFGKNDANIYEGKTETSGGPNYGLTSRHTSGKALGEYQAHPDHIALANYIVSVATKPAQVVDFVNLSKL